MLKRLILTNFRNYPQAEIFPDPKISLIYGANGSGKTSLLEAVYTLSTGRSFRTGKLGKLVRDQADAFSLFAEVQRGDDIHRLGMQRGRQGIEALRLDGAKPKGLSEMAHVMPTQAFHPESVELIYGEAAQRRSFLDWGLFHVEHEFLENWRRLRHALEHRNFLLKQPGRDPRELRAWDEQLVQVSVKIDAVRRHHLDQIAAHFHEALQRLGTLSEVDFVYHSGWPEGETLAEALAKHLQQDIERGFTSMGPQRADVRIRAKGHLAKDLLSRGQCKTLGFALLLAQLRYFVSTGRQCLLLVDDLSSELDVQHRHDLFGALCELNQQMLVTALDKNALAWNERGDGVSVFHVEHGWLRPETAYID